jgi:hypothetical protein
LHVQDIQPSPDPEFIECPRCGQPVLKDNLSRQWNEWGQICLCESCGSLKAGCHVFDEPVPAPISDLQRLPATTQRILETVRQLTRDFTEIPARVFTSMLETLIDELVSSLVPLMAAEERVLCDGLDPALGDVLREDHLELRRFTERLTMLAEGLQRSVRGALEKPMRTALLEMTTALVGLCTHQQAALRHLSETLPVDELARLAATLDAAVLDAREQTMLIVRPAIPPTAAHVLRDRPDLNAAYAMSLADIERQSQRRSQPAEGR